MSVKTKRKAFLYVPFMIFNPYHHIRDQGGTASGFVLNGYETYLIIGESSELMPITDFKIIKTHNTDPRNLFSHIREYKVIIKLLKDIEPDTILVWNVGVMPLLVSITMRLLKILGKKKSKAILRLDWDGTRKKENLFLDIMFRVNLIFSNLLFDGTTIETSCGKRNVDRLILRPDKLKIVPVGYDLRGKGTIAVDSKKGKYVLSVARIAKYKNIEQSLEAFALVSLDFPEWSFVHVGMCQDGIYFESLKELTKKLNIENKVIFAGELEYEEVDSWFSKSPIFITSSHTESFNLARLEAMVHGLIVISSEAGCPNDFKGLNIFSDIQSASVKLREALEVAEKKDMRFHMDYGNIFSWPDIVKKLEESFDL